MGTETIFSAFYIAMAAFGNGMIPMGMPPGEEDPALVRMAPADCVLFASWPERGEADPKSTNHTEQLLAEPSIREFLGAWGDLLGQAMREDNDNKELLEVGLGIGKILVNRPGAIFAGNVKLTIKEEPPEDKTGGRTKRKPGIPGVVVIEGMNFGGMQGIGEPSTEAKPKTPAPKKEQPQAPTEAESDEDAEDGGEAEAEDEETDEEPDVDFEGEVVLVINAGEQADELARQIKRLIPLLESDQEIVIEDITIAGSTWQQCTPEDIDQPITWGFHGKYFMLGLGKKTIENTINRVKAPTPDWFTELRKKASVPRPSLTVYCDTKNMRTILKDIFKTLADGGELEEFNQVMNLFEGSKITDVTSLGLVNGFDDNGLVSRTVIQFDKTKKKEAGASVTQLSLDDMKSVPRDATFTAAFTVDIGVWLRFIEKLSRLDEDTSRIPIYYFAKLKEKTGLDLKKELEKPLTARVRVFCSGDEGDWFMTGTTAIIRFNDHKRAMRIIEAHQKVIVEMIKEGNTDEIIPVGMIQPITGTCQFNGQTIHYLSSSSIGVVSPAWCARKDDVVMSLRIDTLKSVLDRRDDFRSLAEVPEIAALFAGKNKPSMVYVENTPLLVRYFYPLVNMVASTALGAAGESFGLEGIDQSKLPPPSVLYRHVRHGTIAVEHTDDTTIVSMRSTVPVMSAPMVGLLFIGGVTSVMGL